MTIALIRRPCDEGQNETGRRQRLERRSHKPRSAGSRQELGEEGRSLPGAFRRSVALKVP